MTQDNRPSAEGMEALRKRFEAQSEKARSYYTVMHAMRRLAGSDDKASAWMSSPLADFEGRTPAELIADGRTDDLLRYIASLDG